MIPIDAVAQKVKEYNKRSFIEWKVGQGAAYEDNIANLRWKIDFNKHKALNLALIDQWSSDETQREIGSTNQLIEENDPK